MKILVSHWVTEDEKLCTVENLCLLSTTECNKYTQEHPQLRIMTKLIQEKLDSKEMNLPDIDRLIEFDLLIVAIMATNFSPLLWVLYDVQFQFSINLDLRLYALATSITRVCPAFRILHPNQISDLHCDMSSLEASTYIIARESLFDHDAAKVSGGEQELIFTATEKPRTRYSRIPYEHNHELGVKKRVMSKCHHC